MSDQVITQNEASVVVDHAAEGLSQLAELQLALIGGGIGNVTIA